MAVRKTDGAGGFTPPRTTEAPRQQAARPPAHAAANTAANTATNAVVPAPAAGALPILTGRSDLFGPPRAAAQAGTRALDGAPRSSVAVDPRPQRVAGPPAPALGTAAFESRLDGLTGSRSRDGNRVTMLFDGTASFAERERMIRGAQSSIHLQTFIFTSDDTGWALARMLADKAKEGVSVRVIYDAIGSNRADPAMFEHMRAAGVEVRPYGDPLTQFWDLNDRWHEKHLIVDGRASIQGGMNIGDEYALGGSGRQVMSRGETTTEPWRDVDAKLEGPAVADTQAAFLRNWSELGAPVSEADRAALFPTLERKGGSNVRVVQHRPDEEGDQHTHQLYLQAIRSARDSITIENAYFLPPQELRDALVDAARRGVKVRVMTNSRASNDIGIVSDAARYFYDPLIAAGVQIFEKQGATLHSKSATFDGVYSIVGSVNLNGRSQGRDSEVALAVDDPTIAAALQRRFGEGVRETKQVTMAELRGESFLTNLKQFSLSLLAWTF